MPQPISVGLLLAAGCGRRFDPTGSQNKLTQLLDNGTPVAVQAAHNLRSAVTKVIAVVRCSTLAQQLVTVGCEVHLFTQAELGMGASLAFAMNHVIDSNLVLVALADMPYVQTETSRKIVDALTDGADIVQPVFRQQSGHPIGFSKRHFPALMALSGDIGARHLLREFPVHQVVVEDAGILRDIDFLLDLA
jgi:molybdenum cofactor cytidylyltransferase